MRLSCVKIDPKKIFFYIELLTIGRFSLKSPPPLLISVEVTLTVKNSMFINIVYDLLQH